MFDRNLTDYPCKKVVWRFPLKVNLTTDKYLFFKSQLYEHKCEITLSVPSYFSGPTACL